MSEESSEFFAPVGPSASATPSASRIFNIALAATTNTPIDLTGSDYVGLKTAIDGGKMLTLTPSGDVWYRWATATGTVDPTKTAASTPANQGVLLPSGIRVPERPPLGATWIIAYAAVACTLCIQVSSLSVNAYVSGAVDQ
jgi:hypothetical protein